MKMWLPVAATSEKRLCHFQLEGSSASGLTRGEASLRQIRNDLTTGLDEGNILTLPLKGIRNIGVAAWHAINNILPTVLNSGNDQSFAVEQRDGVFDGTWNSITKIFQTKGILGKASAVFSEATDGPVDDGLNLIGGAQWIIVPETNRFRSQMSQSLAADPSYTLAA